MHLVFFFYSFLCYYFLLSVYFQETIKFDPMQDVIYVFPAWIAHNVTPSTARRVVFVWDTIAVPA
jgi:hypothetical protein